MRPSVSAPTSSSGAHAPPRRISLKVGAISPFRRSESCSAPRARGAPTPPAPENTAAAEEAIVGGTLATQYPEAAYLNIDLTATGGYACSGALISPRVVLTAGHCVDTHKAWEVHVGAEVRKSASAATYDWNEKGASTVNPNHHDIGLVFLDQDVKLAAYPTIASAALPNNAKVTNVGRINNGSMTNAAYAADSLVTAGSAIGYPFDYASSAIIQPGDSGGPDFAAGTHSIVSVNSGAGGSTEVLARVDLLRDWILAQIASHGGSPAAPAPPPPAPPPPPTCPADVEPNNALASASKLAAGTSCGALTAGDLDWSLVVATAGTTTLTLGGSGDAVMAIGQASATGCTPTITGLRSFSATTKAGQTYCVLVKSPLGASQAYTLTRN